MDEKVVRGFIDSVDETDKGGAVDHIRRYHQTKLEEYWAENKRLLSLKPTRQLLQLLAKARAFGGSYSEYHPNGPYFTIAQLKGELAKREHIPNKKEARKLRQQKSKR